MAFTYGNVAVVEIDGTAAGSLVDISQYTSSVNPTREREEATLNRLGGNPAARLVGPSSVTIDLEGWLDPIVDEIFELAMSEATPVTRSMRYAPQGETTGQREYTGEVYVLSYDVDTSSEDAATWSATVVVDGAWTQGVIA